MTHEERLALIYKPFFITRFSPSYQWSGCNTGGYLFADITGGRHVTGAPDDDGNYSNSRDQNWKSPLEDISSLYQLQMHICDTPVTKFDSSIYEEDI